jgi:hypothetical protein
MFEIGQRVRILQDEGYDLPEESQGQLATVQTIINNYEAVVRTDDGLEVQVGCHQVDCLAGL